MINILIFDDRFTAREVLCDELKDFFSNQVRLTTCKDVYEANDAIYRKKYDVIIIDSMMSTMGLSKEQEKLSREGLITGIVWLCGVYKDKPDRLKNTCVYVLSGYLDDVRNDNTINDLQKYIQDDHFINNTIQFVAKKGNGIEYIMCDIAKKYKLANK